MLSDDLKDKYKHISPESLLDYGLLARGKNSGYVCPFCGNGEGEDGTGADFNPCDDGYKGYCHRCSRYFDVFDLIGQRFSFTLPAQFNLAMNKAKEIFGDAPKILPPTRPIKPREKPVEDFTKLIQMSWQNLGKLFAENKTWRGLTRETMDRFGCGYLDDWIRTGTDRVIIPTSMNHYLARYPRDTNDSRINVKPHRGSKEIFGIKRALETQKENPTSPIFAVEGEIDAMSISQCGFAAIAFSGSDISKYQQTLLEQIPKTTKLILMLDSDATGREKSPKVAGILKEKGFSVSQQFLDEKFADANAWLQVDPNGLKNELTRLSQSAEEDFKRPKGIEKTEFAGINQITDEFERDDNPSALTDESSGIKTQMQIQSCPLNLTIPAKFVFKAKGVYVLVTKKVGKETQTEEVLVSMTPVIPTKILSKSDHSDTQVELAIYNRRQNSWHCVTTAMSTIANPQSLVKLADHGLHITIGRARAMSEFLTDIQMTGDNESVIPKVKIYEQTGWVGENCEKFLYPPGKDDYVVKNGGFDYEEKFKSKGDEKEWVNLFFETYEKSVAMRYTAGLVLSAPLVKLCGSRSWQGILVAKSGSAKSAMAKLAMSIFGNPEGLHTTFNGTSNFTDEISPKLNDLPSWLDEFQSANEKVRKDFQTLIYNYAEGLTKGRLNRNAEMKKQYHFNGTRICTSEQVVLQSHFTQGAFNRTIELQGFTPLPNELGQEIHRAMTRTYGHFGQRYIDYVSKNRTKITREYLDLYKTLKEEFDLVDHHADQLALNYVAQEAFFAMLAEAGYVREGKTAFEMLDEGDIKYYRSILPSPADADNVARAQDFLREICSTNIAQFNVEEIDDKTKMPSGFTTKATLMPVLGHILADRSVEFYPHSLNDFLIKHGYPPAQTLMRAFAEKGLLEYNPDTKLGREFKTWSDGKRRVYKMKKEAFEDNEE